MVLTGLRDGGTARRPVGVPGAGGGTGGGGRAQRAFGHASTFREESRGRGCSWPARGTGRDARTQPVQPVEPVKTRLTCQLL